MMVKLILVTINLTSSLEKVQPVVTNKEVFVRFVAGVNPRESEGGLQVHLLNKKFLKKKSNEI